RMSLHFEKLLREVTWNPDVPVSRLNILTDAEINERDEWQNTAFDFGQSASLGELLESQAAVSPREIAVVFEDQSLTYDELNKRANRLAHWLKSQGVAADATVAVLMERSVEMVVALVGVIKAGASYLPLDPEYPEARLRFMIDDARPRVILTQSRFAESRVPTGIQTLPLDRWGEQLEEQSDANVAERPSAENLAYVIYTSGSTGQPKGAMNTHGGIVNRLLWMQEAYQLDVSDQVLQKTPFTFDVSVWEFFWPLISGARLVIARPGGHRDPSYLVDEICKNEITTIHFVPSMLQAFLDNPRARSARSIRRVICSGEALSPELQERFFSSMSCELHNLYGPTEAAVDVTSWECETRPMRSTVPIGRPISNIQTHVLDSHLQASPVGVPGELYIGGAGLARGYMNRAALTAEKFIPNPFGKPGSRLYRTGDLARFLPQGEIEFLGRVDHQVKIRGFRIELGEIEAALRTHAAIKEAVIVARESASG